MKQEFIELVNELVQTEKEINPNFESKGNVNKLLLAYYNIETGQTDFKTFKTWMKEGLIVRKGEKGYPIFSRPIGKIKEDQGKEATASDYKHFGTCYLFHAGQVEERQSKHGANIPAPKKDHDQAPQPQNNNETEPQNKGNQAPNPQNNDNTPQPQNNNTAATVTAPQPQNNRELTPLQQDLQKCIIDGNVLRLPAEILPNYAELRKSLLNAGATYKRSTFIFPSDARAYVNTLMGGVINLKKEYQFFETPEALANSMVSLADIQPDQCVLEPSAGHGAIVRAIGRANPEISVDCYELTEMNRDILLNLPNCILLGDDFLQAPEAFKYDRIIANPPFRNNQDINHIYKMYELLYEGGRIVTIASNSWRTGSQKKQEAFRQWLDSVGAVVEDIAAGTFTESGTNIATCMIIIDK
jgi:hypothetical protein